MDTSKPSLAAHKSCNDSFYHQHHHHYKHHHNTEDTLESLRIEKRWTCLLQLDVKWRKGFVSLACIMHCIRGLGIHENAVYIFFSVQMALQHYRANRVTMFGQLRHYSILTVLLSLSTCCKQPMHKLSYEKAQRKYHECRDYSLP